MANLISIERHPKVSMKLLRGHGIFNSSNPIHFEVGGDQLEVSYSREDRSIRLVWTEGDNCVSFDVSIFSTPLRYGWRYYFDCPSCHAPREEIHLIGDHAACRQCFRGWLSVKGPSNYERRFSRLHALRDRLLGQDGRSPPRGANRDRIVDELASNPDTLRIYPELAEKLGAELRKRARRTRRAAREQNRSRLAFSQAIERGQQVQPPAWLNEVDFVERLTEQQPDEPQSRSTIGIAEHHPALDIRLIAKVWKLHETGVWVHSLEWPQWSRMRPMTLVAERISDEEAHLLVVTEDQDGRRVQRIRAQAWRGAPGRRWFLICGYTGARSVMLYFRDGIFASARHQRLVHGSQRAASNTPHAGPDGPDPRRRLRYPPETT